MNPDESQPAAVPAAPPSPTAGAQPGGFSAGHTAQPLQHARSVGEALANLAGFIPGFSGYKTTEDRRIADKQLRAAISERLSRVRERLLTAVEARSRSGSLAGLDAIDSSTRRLERLIDRLRFADYGYAAVFDRVHMGEAQVERLYEYDAATLARVGDFDAAAAGIESASGGEQLTAALAAMDALTAEVDRRFEARKHLFDGLPNT
jgi:hypothetical protein